MLEDLQFSWRTHRWVVAIPLLVLACLGVVVLSAFGGDEDQPTALQADSAPSSTAQTPIDTQPAAAPELQATNESLIITADGSATSSAPVAVVPPSGDQTEADPSTTAPPTTQTGAVTESSGPEQATTQPSTTEQAPEQTTTQATTGSTCPSGDQFELVFRDDFNGDSLGPHWRQYNSTGNNGFGLRRPSANAVSNGMLVITAEMIDGQLVSGGMAHDYDQQYGKYVFRVRTDDDPDQATSGVVLTWPESQVHPRDGENNIYETLAHTPQRTQFFSVIHKPFGQKGDQEYFIHNANGAVFQTMTMEWLPGRITITRQGESPGDRETVEVIETDADLIPDNPHHVAIQLDAWKQQMSTTVQMEVDYIEVHRYCG